MLQTIVLGCHVHRLLGLELDGFDAEVRVDLPLCKDFSRKNGEVELHGGITAALIDIAGDCSVAVRTGKGVPNIDLRIDHLNMGGGARITASARAVRLGRSIGTVDVEVRDATDAVIAIGRGKYSTV